MAPGTGAFAQKRASMCPGCFFALLYYTKSAKILLGKSSIFGRRLPGGLFCTFFEAPRAVPPKNGFAASFAS
ncbi:MAG TPA: hypothetical protein DCL51_03850 [Ruthenibacterium lactatiformans]|nr:hypothetical protein DW194_11755 [Subdoligranulum sp. AM16-9]RGD21661.1 hypothetical protein DW651_06160 [Subdoligranulum sp. AM23-21AC]RJW31270.1 hypothetical protein DXC43_08420 [Subdoligranulum sp. TF05-17AC]RJW81180.1 hypothetical protein DXA32_11690 [Subdoligranulum sp. OF01-18]HAG64840.1 hypothetical protein [Ruthenibacterium lactatiformans]